MLWISKTSYVSIKIEFLMAKRKFTLFTFTKYSNNEMSSTFTGVCMMSDNKKGNIVIFNQAEWAALALQHSSFLEENYDKSGFTNENVSTGSSYNENQFNTKFSGSVMNVDAESDEIPQNPSNADDSVIMIDWS